MSDFIKQVTESVLNIATTRFGFKEEHLYDLLNMVYNASEQELDCSEAVEYDEYDKYVDELSHSDREFVEAVTEEVKKVAASHGLTEEVSVLLNIVCIANRPETYIHKCCYCKNTSDARWEDIKCSLCDGPFKGFANRMTNHTFPGSVEVVAHIEEAEIKEIVNEYLREVNVCVNYVEFDALWVVTTSEDGKKDEIDEIRITLYFKLVEGKVRYLLEFSRTSGMGDLYKKTYNELKYRLT